MTEITGIATKWPVHVVHVPAVLLNIWLFALKCVEGIVTLSLLIMINAFVSVCIHQIGIRLPTENSITNSTNANVFYHLIRNYKL